MRRKLTGTATALVAAGLIGLAGCSGATPLSGGSSNSASSAGSVASPSGGTAGSSGSSSSSGSAGSFSSAGSAGSGPGGTAGSATSMTPSSPAPESSVSTELPGLSTDCTAAVNAQVGVADIFGRAVDGTKLTAKDVSAVFGTISADAPAALAGDISTLRDAAERSVGKSDVAVAEILQERKVSAAREALSGYVQKCSPPTA